VYGWLMISYFFFFFSFKIKLSSSSEILCYCCVWFRPRVCHSCLHLCAENIRLSAELAELRVGDPVRQVRFLLADQVREFRHISLQSRYMVARSELANCRQALNYMNAALVSSDGERNALREIVARCECVARPKSATVSEAAGDVAPGLGAAENVAVGVLSGCFGGPAPGALPAVRIICLVFYGVFVCHSIDFLLQVVEEAEGGRGDGAAARDAESGVAEV
jgi:hypothetical protein